MTEKNIVVVGSCMIDFVSYSSRLPKPGETIHGSNFFTNFGGKGANQCVASAKLGAKTTFIARVGTDIWGDKYIENLNQLNVETKFVQKTNKSNTGTAQIIVSESDGQNQIVIVGGANKLLTPEDVVLAKNVIQSAKVLVLQLETSQEVALKALELCKGISILNGAPALSDCNPNLFKFSTIFCVNETEAAIFTGLPVNNKKEAEEAVRCLINKGCSTVIITLGSDGALLLEEGKKEIVHISCINTDCVDSTGAGDAFIGALAYLLSDSINFEKCSLSQIVEMACFIASDSVTKRGTQASFPGAEILKNAAEKVPNV